MSKSKGLDAERAELQSLLSGREQLIRQIKESQETIERSQELISRIDELIGKARAKH
jgi:hypothetical protein